MNQIFIKTCILYNKNKNIFIFYLNLKNYYFYNVKTYNLYYFLYISIH